MEEYLKRFGLTTDKLSDIEIETLQKWAEDLSKNELTVHKIKEHIEKMIVAVSKELANSIDDRKWWFQRLGQTDLSLKMRLKNYIMLQDFLNSPEKARKFLEASLSNLKKKS